MSLTERDLIELTVVLEAEERDTMRRVANLGWHTVSAGQLERTRHALARIDALGDRPAYRRWERHCRHLAALEAEGVQW